MTVASVTERKLQPAAGPGAVAGKAERMTAHARDRTRRSVGTVLLAAFVIAALAASLVGCGGRGAVASSVAGKVGSRLRSLPAAGEAVRIPKAPLPPVPRAQVQALAAAAERQATTLIAPYVNDLPLAKARDVVQGACLADDLIEIGRAGSWDGAAAKALASFGGSSALRNRVADLAKDMAEARFVGDRAVTFGVFLLCETA